MNFTNIIHSCSQKSYVKYIWICINIFRPTISVWPRTKNRHNSKYEFATNLEVQIHSMFLWWETFVANRIKMFESGNGKSYGILERCVFYMNTSFLLEDQKVRTFRKRVATIPLQLFSREISKKSFRTHPKRVNFPLFSVFSTFCDCAIFLA